MTAAPSMDNKPKLSARYQGIADGLETKYQYDINSFIADKSTEIICINTFLEEVSVKSN